MKVCSNDGKTPENTYKDTHQTKSSDHQNLPIPEAPQNQWRMPSERMELMSDYLAVVGR